MKSKQLWALKGDFYIKVTHIDTGKEDHYEGHNVALANFSRMLSGMGHTNWSQPYGRYMGISFGQGSGTPSASDTGLFSNLWGRIAPLSMSRAITKKDELQDTITVRVPATASYVGTLTEVGLWAANNGNSDYLRMITHALIVDAENNPITIEKTDLMQLDVRYVVTYQFYDSYPYFCSPLSAIRTGRSDQIPAMCDENGNFWSGTNVITMHECVQHKLYHKNIGGRHCIFEPHSIASYQRSFTATWDNNALRWAMANCRIAATEGNTHYVFSIAEGRYLRINMDLIGENFSRVTLAGMNIGTGDGSTQDFDPPIGLWYRDSEIIYIDGVAKVRDVDYTCDNCANIQNLPELWPFTHAIVHDGQHACSNTLAVFQMFAYDKTCNSVCVGRDVNANFVPWTDKPLILELPIEDDSELNWGVDTICLYWYVVNSFLTSVNPTIKIAYSDDLETWHDFAGGEAQKCTQYQLKTYQHNEEVVAKYWKFTVTAKDSNPGLPQNNTNPCGLRFCGFRRNPQKIHFTTPPAAGAVITMDAQIDRPLKNDKHVIDFNPVVQF